MIAQDAIRGIELTAPRFSPANSKLRKLSKTIGKRVYSFDLLAGHTCCYAKDCAAKAVRHEDGTTSVQDGKYMDFRCYAVSLEAMYKATYDLHASNTAAMARHGSNSRAMADALLSAIPRNAEVIRIHTAGDFYSSAYFKAWCLVASARPDLRFYAYTKALPLVLKHHADIPSNLMVTMSRGGTQDKLIPALKGLGYHEAIVVASEDLANAMHLDVDHDDSHAYHGESDFALVIHGTQPKRG